MFSEFYETKKATVFRIMAATLFILLAFNDLLSLIYDLSIISIIFLLSESLCSVGLFMGKKSTIICGIGGCLLGSIGLLITYSSYSSSLYNFAIIFPYIFTIITLLICSNEKEIIKRGTKPLGYSAIVFVIAAVVIDYLINNAFDIKDMLCILFSNKSIDMILSVAFVNLWSIEISKEN